MELTKTCVAILAGGASKRMGRPKLLAPFVRTTLLDHALDTTLSSVANEVCLVTGAYHEAMADHLVCRNEVPHHLSVVYNQHWQEGQSTSVKTAVQFAQQRDCAGLLLLVADQPFVTAQHIDALIAAHYQGSALAYIASNGQHHGNPCIFDKSAFEALFTLEGDEGARALFRSRPDAVVQHVQFDDPYLFEDVDTPEDLARLEELMLCVSR